MTEIKDISQTNNNNKDDNNNNDNDNNNYDDADKITYKCKYTKENKIKLHRMK